MDFSLLSLKLCVLCTYFAALQLGSIEATKKDLQVITDLEKVQFLTKRYIRHRSSPMRTGTSIAARVFGRKSILDREPAVQEAFCRFIIQPEENGFKLNYDEYKPVVETQKFRLMSEPPTSRSPSYHLTQESDESTHESVSEQGQETGDQSLQTLQTVQEVQESDPQSGQSLEQSGAGSSQLSVEIPSTPTQEPGLETELLELPMYACPPILYFDYINNDWASFTSVHRVSKGRKFDSAIVFLQESRTSTLYPVKYVKNISFTKLMENYGRRKEEIPTPPRDLEMAASTEQVKRETEAYLNTRRISATYEKFAKLFHSINICAQRKLPKIHACRQAMQNSFAFADVETYGYDEYVCRRIQIYFEGETRQNYNPNKNLYVLQCPPMISILHSRNDKFPIIHYLSSNLQPNSVILSWKTNIKGEITRPVDIDSSLSAEFIRKDTARARFIPYPTPNERELPVYRKSYSELDWKVETVPLFTVQMPVTYAQTKGIVSRPKSILNTIRVSADRWLADDVLIEFSRVKGNTLIYQRFAALHTSLDVCQLTLLQRRDLCQNIASHLDNFVEITSSNDGFDYKCEKHIISLTSRDAEYLQTKIFSMWQCPVKYPENNKYHYHVGKTHLRDAALVYRFSKEDPTFFPDGVIYPDATAINISRQILAYAGKPIE